VTTTSVLACVSEKVTGCYFQTYCEQTNQDHSFR
jgi:hypothetical protein